jgi:hypothetical protein
MMTAASARDLVANTVAQLLGNIIRPVYRLSQEERQNDPETLRKNRHILRQITPGIVRKAVEKDVERVADQRWKDKIKRLEKEMKDMKEDLKVSVSEKTDAIVPLSYYSLVNVSSDSFAKASQQLSNSLKLVATHVSFATSPWDYCYELLSESNAVASNFSLTRNQQKALILSHIPSFSTQHHLLSRTENLVALFSLVAQYSTRAKTRIQL